MSYFRIWLLSAAAAVLYGILHDSVTTRVCVEYFTIGHPAIFSGTANPTLLALGWGVIATWWVGLGLGVPLSLVARVGSRPKLSAGQLVRPIGVVLSCMAIASLGAGVAGFHAASSGRVTLPSWIGAKVLETKHVAFLSVWWAHQAAYDAGFLGGLALWIWAWVRRWKLAIRMSAKPAETAIGQS